MASLFLSYDHQDVARAAAITAALEANGHSVWWDRHLHGGAEFNSEIEEAVERSDAVVVLWSKKSVQSAWVRDEAAEGRDRGRLIPVLIDAVKPPMGFRQFQTVDMSSWKGGKKIPALADLLRAVEAISAAPAAAVQRPAPRPAPGRALPAVSRRVLVLGTGAAAALAASGGGLWWALQSRDDPRLRPLLDRAEGALRAGTADEETNKQLERAVAIQPDSARAWGLLALIRILASPGADPKESGDLVRGSSSAARQALSLDPAEDNALLAMFHLEGSALDWATRDARLRQIIAINPKNVLAIEALVVLVQAAGMNQESYDLNERALALEPLSSDLLGLRALKLWILGRNSEADKVIDQARSLYPESQWVRWNRFLILALSGRSLAAGEMFKTDPSFARNPNAAKVWRTALSALDQPSEANVSAARAACLEGAVTTPELAGQGVLIMSALGQVDTAFDIANGFLMSRGPVVRREQAGGDAAKDAAGRINTQWLFLPAAASMRADSRFLHLCDGVGLVAYWRKRGVKPDYQLA
ncbi:MAG: TIR domain-containing protein [Sphingomicrobium sp.]